jgi:hypothetical protein
MLSLRALRALAAAPSDLSVVALAKTEALAKEGEN